MHSASEFWSTRSKYQPLGRAKKKMSFRCVAPWKIDLWKTIIKPFNSGGGGKVLQKARCKLKNLDCAPARAEAAQRFLHISCKWAPNNGELWNTDPSQCWTTREKIPGFSTKQRAQQTEGKKTNTIGDCQSPLSVKTIRSLIGLGLRVRSC